MTVALTPDEVALLQGDGGAGSALAMRIVVKLAETMDAPSLLPITGAHIDSCLFHGQSGLDFVHRLSEGDSEVTVPTTLNVSSLDLLHPELFQGDDQTRVDASALMDAYVALGRGEHIAWAESNAIVFANSVLGARTHRYGDFIDIAAAITGRVPNAGLHRNENRLATIVFDVRDLPESLHQNSIFPALLGFVIGARAGSAIPAILGLRGVTTEDDLKALGAAAASTGSTALFHAVGVTPEAPTLQAATGGRTPPKITVTVNDLTAAAKTLNSAATAGVQFVTDTCTYITPIVRNTTGLALTDSAKWAYYAPGNIGVEAILAGTADCVASAVAGELRLTNFADG